jgi:hypothetical protein
MKQHILDWVLAGAGSQVLSAFARALPEPVPMGSRFYLFVYRFCNALLINWDLSGKEKSQ